MDERVLTGRISTEQTLALAGVLSTEAPTDHLPPAWHCVHLLEHPDQEAIGPDGHSLSGLPAPPGPGMSRMFAGGTLLTHRLLTIDEPATLRVAVTDSVTKQGRSGEMTFTTITRTITQHDELAVEEHQTIVYRERTPVTSTAAAPPRANGADPDVAAAEGWSFAVDETLLFRFSALTYNAHRIHYDRDFAHEDGHPDLVVHGPLQALLMAEAVRRRGDSLVGRRFTYRLVRPAYGGQTLTVSAAGPEIGVRDRQGNQTATATLDDAP
jgi:3-methylfumaryl-CoA hydratase